MSRTQELLVPTPATQPRLERSSWKVEAIRRGKLKISGPLPVNEQDDDVFQPTKPLLDPPSAHQAPPESTLPPKNADALGIYSQSDFEGGRTHVPDAGMQARDPQPNPAAPELPSFAETHRHTLSDITESHRRPSPSVVRSTTDSPAEQLPAKARRQSGLKNVFKRMFSRRGKRESRKDIASSPRHGYSQSDPGALALASKKASNVYQTAQPSQSTLEQPQTIPATAETRALAPVQEVLILTPQRSHLPFPMNVNAPDETTPLSEAAEFDEKTPELKKRRATLPSVVTNSAEVSALAAVWSQSGTKVTAAEEQALKSPSHSQIGIALSSPNQALRVHRKSQSAGALRDLARRHNEPLLAPNNKTSRAPMRRRSAEIRYWRESVGARSFSVYSDLAPREDIDDSVVDDDKEIEVYEGAAAADNPVEQKARAMGPSHILAFNFGDLAEATPTAAPAHSSENVVDSRSQRSVSARSEPTQQYAAPRSKPQTVIIADAPKEKRSSRQRSSSTVRENFSRPSSVREASSAAAAHAQAQKSFPPTAASTPLPSRTPRTAAAQHDEKTAGHVPTTVRPSEPSAHDPDFPSPATQFHAIYTILRHERSARKVLEKQILALNREVSDLRALTLKMSRNNGGGAGTYPTPSPDLANHSADASSFRREAEDEFRHEDEGLGQSLGYDHLAAWQDGFAPNDRRRETAISRFSKFDTEDEAEDASSRADDEEGAEEEEEEEEEEANADADDDDNDDDDDDDNDNDALAKLHRASAQTHTTHESEGLVMKSAPARKRTPPTTNSTKAGSVSVSQNSSAHSTNVGSPDVWETPLEEAVAYGFGFGHEDGSSGNGNAGHAASRVVSPGRSGAGDEDMF